jgi:hypothetical protein
MGARNLSFPTNKEHKKVKQAVQALEALGNFLDNEASPEFFESYSEEHDTDPDLKLRPFWREHLGSVV